MDEQTLQALFEQTRAKAESGDGKTKISFSEDETNKFKKAFSDPEFRKMFSDLKNGKPKKALVDYNYEQSEHTRLI